MSRVAGGVLAASAAAVALTLGTWLRGPPPPDPDRFARKADFSNWNKPLAEGRCTIDVANFGGGQARLVRVETGGIVHFAVVESARRNSPMNALQQGDWLREKYGDAQTTTLGRFGSTKEALGRAGQLCPLARRCVPGRPGCEELGAPRNPLESFAFPSLPGVPPARW